MLLNGLQGLGCRVKLLDRIQGLSSFGVCGVLKGGIRRALSQGSKGPNNQALGFRIVVM